MAIPGDTPIPVSLCSRAGAVAEVSSILIELAFDQVRERPDRYFGVASGRGQLDERARCGGQHHQPHDRSPRYRGAVLAYPNFAIELRGRLNEADAAARM